MMECLDLSWPFDAVHLDNKAAVFPAAGGFVGVTLIYAGATQGMDRLVGCLICRRTGVNYLAWTGAGDKSLD